MNATSALDKPKWLGSSEVWRQVCAALAMSAWDTEPPAICAKEQRDVESALDGNHEAFGRLIDRYQVTIAEQMRRFSRQPGVVDELVHDVFVEAFVSLKSYRTRGPFLHWLRKIAVRTGYKFWKRRQRDQSNLVSFSEIGDRLEQLGVHEAERSATWASEMLGDLLECLAPRDRLVITLLYWDGYSVAEAAELCGWSKSMVKVQAFRARKRLKQLIEDSEE